MRIWSSLARAVVLAGRGVRPWRAHGSSGPPQRWRRASAARPRALHRAQVRVPPLTWSSRRCCGSSAAAAAAPARRPPATRGRPPATRAAHPGEQASLAGAVNGSVAANMAARSALYRAFYFNARVTGTAAAPAGHPSATRGGPSSHVRGVHRRAGKLQQYPRYWGHVIGKKECAGLSVCLVHELLVRSAGVHAASTGVLMPPA